MWFGYFSTHINYIIQMFSFTIALCETIAVQQKKKKNGQIIPKNEFVILKLQQIWRLSGAITFFIFKTPRKIWDSENNEKRRVTKLVEFKKI